MNDKIYRTEKEKNEAILKKVIECNKKWTASFSGNHKH